MGEENTGGGTVRFVDSSVERMQVKVTGLTADRYFVTCNGARVPLHADRREGRIRRRRPLPRLAAALALHPTIGVDSPLVFDLVDAWNRKSLGGCTYHVAHPGGRNYTTIPVNSYEAESRRLARFFPFGHTPGQSFPLLPREIAPGVSVHARSARSGEGCTS